MKTELRLQPHSTLGGEAVVQIVRDGEIIGHIYGAVEAGVRIVTKHTLAVAPETDRRDRLANTVEIRVMGVR